MSLLCLCVNEISLFKVHLHWAPDWVNVLVWSPPLALTAVYTRLYLLASLSPDQSDRVSGWICN